MKNKLNKPVHYFVFTMYTLYNVHTRRLNDQQNISSPSLVRVLKSFFYHGLIFNKLKEAETDRNVDR